MASTKTINGSVRSSTVIALLDIISDGKREAVIDNVYKVKFKKCGIRGDEI